jgi:hypothetical protein
MKSFAQAPDFSTLNGSILNGIMTMAGYVDVSVSYGLGDPPFIQRNWATVEVTVSQA